MVVFPLFSLPRPPPGGFSGMSARTEVAGKAVFAEDIVLLRHPDRILPPRIPKYSAVRRTNLKILPVNSPPQYFAFSPWSRFVQRCVCVLSGPLFYCAPIEDVAFWRVSVTLFPEGVFSFCHEIQPQKPGPIVASSGRIYLRPSFPCQQPLATPARTPLPVNSQPSFPERLNATRFG